jgi:ComF family protein
MGKVIAELCELERGTSPALIPVPPRPGKIKEQGWDQVEYLAQALEKGLGRAGQEIRACRCLKRLPSKTQKELGREDRLKNLQNRIILTQKPPQSAIVIDDVITTGATLDACASVLKAGGAERVYGICLVYD